MSILVRHVHAISEEHPAPASIYITGMAAEPVVYIIVHGVEDVAAFKKLVQAGSNLEPNTSPAMKELADLVTVGHIQQPYRS
jgi:hypothetical protein